MDSVLQIGTVSRTMTRKVSYTEGGHLSQNQAKHVRTGMFKVPISTT